MVTKKLGVVIIPIKAKIAQLILLPMFKSNNTFTKKSKEKFWFWLHRHTHMHTRHILGYKIR